MDKAIVKPCQSGKAVFGGRWWNYGSAGRLAANVDFSQGSLRHAMQHAFCARRACQRGACLRNKEIKR
jgi:hypothetical protein